MNTSKKEKSKSSEWDIKFHDDFFKDLDNLTSKDVLIYEKKKKKIKENPLRQKHLSGGENCYREPITRNIRLVYFIHGKIIWMLIIGPHDKSYNEFRKRLYYLRIRYNL